MVRKHVYKNLNKPFHMILIHELHQNYLPHNKTFGQNQYNQHLSHFQRQSGDERNLMVEQSHVIYLKNLPLII